MSEHPSAPVGPSPAPACDDIQAVLTAFFTALANEDEGRLERVVTPDFRAFDGGEDMDLARLCGAVSAAAALGKTFVWRVTELATHVTGGSAWATWRNVGAILTEGGRQDLTWLESAGLEKRGDEWRVRFLHSTRERPAAPVPPAP